MVNGKRKPLFKFVPCAQSPDFPREPETHAVLNIGIKKKSVNGCKSTEVSRAGNRKQPERDVNESL